MKHTKQTNQKNKKDFLTLFKIPSRNAGAYDTYSFVGKGMHGECEPVLSISSLHM